MSERDSERRQRHLEAWGICPLCNREPNVPNEDSCEDCQADTARHYHGRSQAVRLESRPLDERIDTIARGDL